MYDYIKTRTVFSLPLYNFKDATVYRLLFSHHEVSLKEVPHFLSRERTYGRKDRRKARTNERTNDAMSGRGGCVLFFFVIVGRDCRMRMRVCDANEVKMKWISHDGHLARLFLCHRRGVTNARTMGFN